MTVHCTVTDNIKVYMIWKTTLVIDLQLFKWFCGMIINDNYVGIYVSTILLTHNEFILQVHLTFNVILYE